MTASNFSTWSGGQYNSDHLRFNHRYKAGSHPMSSSAPNLNAKVAIRLWLKLWKSPTLSPNSGPLRQRAPKQRLSQERATATSPLAPEAKAYIRFLLKTSTTLGAPTIKFSLEMFGRGRAWRHRSQAHAHHLGRWRKWPSALANSRIKDFI